MLLLHVLYVSPHMCTGPASPSHHTALPAPPPVRHPAPVPLSFPAAPPLFAHRRRTQGTLTTVANRGEVGRGFPWSVRRRVQWGAVAPGERVVRAVSLRSARIPFVPWWVSVVIVVCVVVVVRVVVVGRGKP